MNIRFLDGTFAVAKLPDATRVDFAAGPCFFARTGEEISLVCPSGAVPANAVRTEDGWRCFFIPGPLDFSLVGIMARISGALAGAGIPLMALSTFDTDYILVRQDREAGARAALLAAGWAVE